MSSVKLINDKVLCSQRGLCEFEDVPKTLLWFLAGLLLVELLALIIITKQKKGNESVNEKRSGKVWAKLVNENTLSKALCFPELQFI